MATDTLMEMTAQATRRCKKDFPMIDGRWSPVLTVESAGTGRRSAVETSRQQRREEVEGILAKARDARIAQELEDRLAWIIALKSALDQGIEGARERGEREYKHALVKIKWAAELSYAEDMTETQLEGLVRAAELLQGDEVERETAREISRVLRAHDLDYIPDLEQSVSADD